MIGCLGIFLLSEQNNWWKLRLYSVALFVQTWCIKDAAVDFLMPTVLVCDPQLQKYQFGYYVDIALILAILLDR